DFLERARAGTIAYTPEALKYLADLNERGARLAITNGNRALDRVRRIPGMSEYFGNQPAFSDELPPQGGTAPPITIAPPGGSAPASGVAPPIQAPAAPAPPPLVATPEDAKRLPPGTIFRTPDGRTLRVPQPQVPR
ncbi:MAG: hypothetical protein EBR34_16430, partial [Sphingomonadaceae bacterium]|nr:hypothetical protein [Sphingomonadaceae bacterium]